MQNQLKNSGLALVNASQYNSWQYAQFQKYIGNCVLEIGCGLGNLTQYLLRDTHNLLSVDVKPEAIDFTRQRFASCRHCTIEQLDVFTNGLQHYSTRAFDTIVLSNVLEHIKDDKHAMRMCYDILHPLAGTLLILVPAHDFLYGTLDEESGHYRRYTKKSLTQLAAEAGFTIIDLYAFNFLGALGWYFNYCILRRRDTHNAPSTFQASFFDKVLVAPSRFIESRIKPKIGTSYIMIAKA